MPDFHPISEVIYLFFPSFSTIFVFTDQDLLPFSAGYNTCPSYQDNLLQHCRPNLCFGISISHLGSIDV
jgi:hypothetical protein